MDELDAVIVGTGQAGKPLAGDLADAGLRTAIVERDRVGGTCVVRGCTPTKTMVASARVAYLARRASDYGVETGGVSVDMAAVRKRKRDIVDGWVEGSRRGLEKKDGLELIFGEARFTGPRELEVELRDGGARRLRAERVFVNTGARPHVPPVDGLEEVDFLDSTSVMELGEVPDHLVVLGGGFIGLEFGQMFRRFGAGVTIVEQGDRLAGREDEDVSEALTGILAEDGIRVLTGTEAASVARRPDGGVEVRVEGPDGEAAIEGSHLLVAAGRRPNTDVLDLAATGLATDDRGYLPVNERLETDVEGIWALGDVTGGPPFTHTSYDDYRVVRANLLEGGDRTVDDRLLTYTVFTDPQLGRVGLTEREAREAGREPRVAKLPMERVARAIEMDETRGFMKAVVDSETDRILGAAVLGVDGGEVAMALKIAMIGDLPYTALRDAVLAHPTLAESLNNLFMTLD
ncbi:MAG: mercuric reductase [Gemmatimonadota bacterium]